MTNRQLINNSLLTQHRARVAVALARCKCLGGTTFREAAVQHWCRTFSGPHPWPLM